MPSIPTLSVSLLIRSLLPLSLALSAVTAHLCEPMIYHLLIRDDYGAFHTALICCWGRFSLHSCQLSFRQPANRPAVSQQQNHHRGLLRLLYLSTNAVAHQWPAAWLHVLLVRLLKCPTERSNSKLGFVNQRKLQLPFSITCRGQGHVEWKVKEKVKDLQLKSKRFIMGTQTAWQIDNTSLTERWQG